MLIRSIVAALDWNANVKGTLTSLTVFISQIDTEILRITVKKLFPNSSYIQRKV